MVALDKENQRFVRKQSCQTPRSSCNVIYVSTNTSEWARCDTKSIFERSITGFNSEFSHRY